ncbi:TonB-dependent receptor [Chryseolinea sp. H1M3-3]|uniref:SusC/RagA family TonB-linked outer membrane protein n=1 Tax=Chryseolinea sp. H1M3-3 TaxID=3034144 RepID=UPI0023EB8581|nr:TonB-dependent receptor [Chryseolinea sp. H1M3-3]
MIKLYLPKTWFVVFLLLGSFQAWSQTRVTGKVTSEDDGTALPGVSILEKGTTNGTVTDVNGEYAITAGDNATLIFSFVGFTTQEIPVGSKSSINVVLTTDVIALNEVVVVGYGQQEQKDVTGVVAAVNAENFNKGAIVSPDQLITGKIAGVQILQNSGEPGGQSSIRIRGGTSLNASNEPLYVIDGFPIDNSAFNPGGLASGRNPLNFINPNDIESFTVLKDASAAAIYGSRAANGVIIITTKKGKSGAPEVTYDGWFSVGSIAEKLEVFSADQFREIIAAKAPKHLGRLGTANTDWQDEIYRTAYGQNHSVTISGGTEKFGYRASVGHQDQEGIIRTSDTKRTSFSMSLNQRLLDDDLSITVNLKGSRTHDRFSPLVVGPAMEMDPTQPILDPTSPWGGYFVWRNDAGEYERQATINPVSSLAMVQELGSTNRSIGNIQLDYNLPINGLSANVNLGYDIANGDRERFQPSNYFAVAADTGEIKIENYSRLSQLVETYLNYKKNFEGIKSKLDVIAGYSWQNFNSKYPSLRATRLTDNSYGVNNPSIANKVEAFNSVLENRLISFFGRVNFTYNDRYILTASLRRDGSTRFSQQNRWGVFPSAALAWRVIDEGFMSGLQNTFSDLKFRIGYGVNGNQEIGDYLYIPSYSPSTSTAQYQFGNRFVTTLRPNGYDSNLKWEETSSFNVGLDYGILKGRVYGSLEFYKKNTKDLLFERTVPSGSNLTNIILSNIGEVENTGIELTLNTVAISNANLTWNVSVNAAYNKNEIVALDGSDDPNFKGYEVGGISGGVGNNVQILKVGQPAYSFYVYKQKYGADGAPLVDGEDHNEDGQTNLADMYEDVNNDGAVNDQDRRPFHQRAPKVLLGLSSSVNYKNFDLSFTLRSNLGGYIYNNVASNTANLSRANDNFVPRNMVTSVLKSNFKNPQYFTDYYIESADFLRMDNITLGYTANEILSNKVKLRLYVTAQNLFLLTDYSGLDPEVSSGSGATLAPGIDNNVYPRSRTFIFGLNVGF